MENRFCSGQEESSVPITFNCESNSSVPPPSSSSSSSTCSSSKKVINCCQQSTKDRLRSTITKTSRKKMTKTKKKLNKSSIQKLSNTFNHSTLDRLIEDNLITINLQNELLSFESGLRQLERNKFYELVRFTNFYNEKVLQWATTGFRDVQKRSEKWLKSLKCISSFTNIGTEDQILCIKQHFVDLNIIKSLITINHETKTFTTNEIKLSMAKCPLMTNPKFVRFLASINRIFRLDPIVSVLIVLIYLFDADTPNLQSSFSVRKEYILTIHLLQKYLELNGFTSEQANCEIGTFIGGLKRFLLLFNAKQKVLDCAKSYVFKSSKLLAEIMDISQPPIIIID